MNRLVYLLAVAGIALIACAARRPGGPFKSHFNLYSREQDIELGRQAAAQILKQKQVFPDEAVQSYVRSLGASLAAIPDSEGYPYSYTVITDKSVNAFALPGGPMFINSGLIPIAENAAQLAGVMSHEIAHVVLRHGTSQASKANLLQLPAAIAGLALGEGAGAAVGRLGLSVALETTLLRYSRNAESEADALGAHIMAGAGWDPIEMARFFQKLQSEGGSRSPEFLSDHPDPGNRVRAVQAEVRTLPRRTYRADEPRFQQIRRLVH